MSTKFTRGTTVYRRLAPQPTRRATAEAMYEHILAHPEDLPNGETIAALVFRLDKDRASCVQLTEHDATSLRVSPAATTEIQVEHGWMANHEGPIGGGEVIDRPNRTPAFQPRDTIIHFIRLATIRTIRYHAEEAARVAARFAWSDEQREAS